MSKHYPIEAMLRPPIEWWSAAVCGITGATALLVPHDIYISRTSGILLGVSCTYIAVKRFCQGLYVRRYQKNLVALPAYSLVSSALPKAPGKLFLGKGFKWQVTHTQRLHDCARAGIEKLSSQKTAEQVVGGNPILHGVEPNETDIWMNLNDRVGHTLVLGTTRVGKTRLLEVLVSQDIERGDCVVVLDPKGDAGLLRRIVFEAVRAGREDDLLIFHLGFPSVSARYNPIGHFARITEVANRVANQLPGSGESAAFKEFGWRFVNIITRALVALGRVPDYTQIQRYILNIDQLLLDYCNLWLPTVDSSWKSTVQSIENEINMHDLPIHLRNRSKRMVAIAHYIQRCDFYNPIADGLCSAFNYDKTYFDKITASLLPLLEKLTAGQSAELI
jgi:conjugative coupling factor TraD (SXT/TOL subfamily)